MATAEQTVNGVAGPSVGAEPEAGSNAAHEPARQNAAAVQAADTPMDAPAAGEGAAVEPAAAQTEVAAPDPEPYTSLFKQAKEAPTEFNTWTSLISAAEKLGDIGRIRPVYDAFLAEYPLCYGYWKKYADAEAKYVSLQEASLVYDRGVAAVPYSVDLWGHFALHKQKAGAPVDEVEKLFERGLAYVGMDYLSHGLWDKYLTYELSLGAHAQVTQLYLRLLRMPIQRLDEYRTRFYEYASQHSTAELIAESERQGFAQKLKDEQVAEAAAAAAAAQAAQLAAEQSAATAAQAAASTETAQAMDTTAGGDDVVDAVGQETVAAAGHMVNDITAPAAATAADSTAVDDAPAADAGPDAAPSSQPPSLLTLPTPDDIAATVMADSAAQSAAAVPAATAPSTAPPAINSAFPVSASPAGTVLAPPQDMPAQQTPPVTDTHMPQATIPQSDGPGDDPMEDATAFNAAADQLQAPAASVDPSPAASLASATTGYAAAEADAPPVAPQSAPLTESAAPAAAADSAAGQVVSPEARQPTDGTALEAQQAVAPAAAEDAISEEQIKAAWLSSVDAVWAETKEEWNRRKPFEDAIKRPYFHVKPLDAAQLQNWSRYLDYIEEKKDIGMIIRLYERCLVACASYPDLWMRYVRWQEASSNAAAQVALERATSVHCKRRPEIQLFAARFHERHGNTELSRALFKLVTDRLSPGLISGAVQHANFERRQGNKALACSVYDKFLEREASKESATYAFMVVQYINALQWGFNDAVKARDVYNAALKKAANSLTLWEGVIHFEDSLSGGDRITRVLDIYERAVASVKAESAKSDEVATAPDASATNGVAEDAAAGTDSSAEAAQPQGLTDLDREALSLRAIDFVDMHGDATLLSKVEKQHAQRFKLPGKVATSAAASRKRSSAEAADASASKAAKTAAAATPAAAASYAGAGALPGPPAASAAQASAAMSGYYSSAAPYYQYPQAYPAAQQPYAYPAASAAAAPAYQYQGYYG